VPGFFAERAYRSMKVGCERRFMYYRDLQDSDFQYLMASSFPISSLGHGHRREDACPGACVEVRTIWCRRGVVGFGMLQRGLTVLAFFLVRPSLLLSLHCRSETDLEHIKASFMEKYSKSLAKWVKVCCVPWEKCTTGWTVWLGAIHDH
jgi:hypothetical protein